MPRGSKRREEELAAPSGQGQDFGGARVPSLKVEKHGDETLPLTTPHQSSDLCRSEPQLSLLKER